MIECIRDRMVDIQLLKCHVLKGKERKEKQLKKIFGWFLWFLFKTCK